MGAAQHSTGALPGSWRYSHTRAGQCRCTSPIPPKMGIALHHEESITCSHPDEPSFSCSACKELLGQAGTCGVRVFPGPGGSFLLPWGWEHTFRHHQHPEPLCCVPAPAWGYSCLLQEEETGGEEASGYLAQQQGQCVSAHQPLATARLCHQLFNAEKTCVAVCIRTSWQTKPFCGSSKHVHSMQRDTAGLGLWPVVTP